MRIKLTSIIVFLSLGLILSCGNTREIKKEGTETITNENTADTKEEKVQVKLTTIEWLDFETAIEKNQKKPKYIFIDVYTEWCGWCKKMDASTFVNPEVVAYMNEHFYAVKMDAEMRESIAYNGQLYEYKQYNARAGYNALAVGLLDSQMSFPSFVILDKKEVKRGKIMGYKDANSFLTELKKYVK